MRLVLFLCFIFLLPLLTYGREQPLQTDILIIGAGQSGVMAAIQSARMGYEVLLVSESDWLGGTTTEAGVSALDGNELLTLQHGLWGEFLHRLSIYEANLMQYGWVSLFTFNPRIGNKIFQEWIKEENNITHIQGKVVEILFDKSHDIPKVTGVRLSDGTLIEAEITIDATETGELLALGGIAHRIGWEFKGEFHEPSAPDSHYDYGGIIQEYPLQEATWVFYLQDYGDTQASQIPRPEGYSFSRAVQKFWCAFDNPRLKGEKYWQRQYAKLESKGRRNYSVNSFLNYGRISENLFMINWPQCGNDLLLRPEELLNPENKEQALKELHTHAHWFARYIQDSLGSRYGLAGEIFPANPRNYNLAGMVYLPYYREVRRVIGVDTLTENNILPNDSEGSHQGNNAIAIGNYANDHHYDDLRREFSTKNKTMQWGGRYTGTPFTIPLGALVPVMTDGLIIAEKSISVSHIANGATRLQPIAMLVGQAAGALAAMSVEKELQPYDVNALDVQQALIEDRQAPMILDVNNKKQSKRELKLNTKRYCGHLKANNWRRLKFTLKDIRDQNGQRIIKKALNGFTSIVNAGLVTIDADIYSRLRELTKQSQDICVEGVYNHSGSWIVVTEVDINAE